jgi:uncharacterized protein YcbK (DUF882 family)
VSPPPKTFTRRRILATGGALAGAAAAFGLTPRAFAVPAADTVPGVETVRRLTLKNLHTPEELEVVYRRGDQYVPEALAQIEVILRDYRTGEGHPMDPHLLDILYEVAQSVRVDPVFTVISGYRSPQTNAMLHERSAGVASHSLHMEGRAIDVRLTLVNCADLADKALEMQRGGVGYYRQSDFVHLDTGRVRTWRG